ncbi:MAG TPA: tRNA (adenosine(37)-N6)-threonylcarbamoyltransferase complex ATPase subunit type 1 TsaE [Gammaproteobacteria bacterium]|nr:tRNA (adenosine(37)-N6)-threonylcarbamoyltransferase complex ATPase subunit type 1 TsaE [Gammaproteobacteria bacterium]
MTFLLEGTDATEALGASLADLLPLGAVVYLIGDLGAGKTTLVRGFLRAKGIQGAVKSPTYTLVETYVLSEGCVNHFDLYRLSNGDELELIGVRDYVGCEHICFFEWPDRAQEMLPKATLEITLEARRQARIVQIKGDWEGCDELIKRLQVKFQSV